jgi:hypothetical protein
VTPIAPGPDSLLQTLALTAGPALLEHQPGLPLRTALADMATASVAPTCGSYNHLRESIAKGAQAHQLLQEEAVRKARWVADLDGPLAADFPDLAQYVVEQIHAMATPDLQPPLAVLTLASSITAQHYKVSPSCRLFCGIFQCYTQAPMPFACLFLSKSK